MLVCLYYLIKHKSQAKVISKTRKQNEQKERLNRGFDDILYSLPSGKGHKKLSFISSSFQEKEKLFGAVKGHRLHGEDILEGVSWIQMQPKLKQHNLKMVGDQKH